MNVDRIARAMIAGGPARGFTARVMAPIHGRPRSDFTARVMQRIAAREPEVAPQFRARVVLAQHFRARVALVAAAGALALAVGAAVRMRSGDAAPAAPAPPVVEYVTLPAPRLESHAPGVAPQAAVVRKAAPHPVRQFAVSEPPEPKPAPIYSIAALEAMPGIATRSIEPASCIIPALVGPAPIQVTELPGYPGGSPRKEFKEQS